MKAFEILPCPFCSLFPDLETREEGENDYGEQRLLCVNIKCTHKLTTEWHPWIKWRTNPFDSIEVGPEEVIESWNRAVHSHQVQYALVAVADKIELRAFSQVECSVPESDSGIWLPRQLWVRLQKQVGIFTPDEIAELEDLINSGKAREQDFQRFLERNPSFLKIWGFRDVFFQVLLRRPGGNLIPDIVLADPDLQKAMILELKLPSVTIVRRQKNRERFSGSVLEARAQLHTYREWFREEFNRGCAKVVLGMEVFEPSLGVIIGRSADFRDGLERQRLSSQLSDITIATYDDVLKYAKRRQVFIEETYERWRS